MKKVSWRSRSGNAKGGFMCAGSTGAMKAGNRQGRAQEPARLSADGPVRIIVNHIVMMLCHYIISYCILLFYIVLYHVVLYYITLYYDIFPKQALA